MLMGCLVRKWDDDARDQLQDKELELGPEAQNLEPWPQWGPTLVAR
jgi:hypothetical protein